MSSKTAILIESRERVTPCGIDQGSLVLRGRYWETLQGQVEIHWVVDFDPAPSQTFRHHRKPESINHYLIRPPQSNLLKIIPSI
jgi:hypothetical protein